MQHPLKLSVSLSLALLLFSQHAEARTSLSGQAELSYTRYEAQGEVTDLQTQDTAEKKFTGNSLSQRYSLRWSATDLRYRSQPKYYVVTLGYDWLAFDTKVSEGSQNLSIKETVSKFTYNGEIGYNPVDLPIRVTAYSSSINPTNFRQGINQNTLVNDNLVYALDGNYTTGSRGINFSFDPDMATGLTARSLPRFNLEYNETSAKSLGGFYQLDNIKKELSVAGLAKGNNWVNFRTLSYEDHLNGNNNTRREQLQIGLVDSRGRRLWSNLSNWIEVSADGQLTTSSSYAKDSEEYDLNFMAVASRSSWGARTFLNYNRLTDEVLTEEAKIPVYISGVYGADTTWYLRLSADRGKQTIIKPVGGSESSYSNTISVGATTFSRSAFTLSPSLSVNTNKGYGGTETFNLNAALETNSTARFSRKAGLAARTELKYQDNGLNSETSKTWSNKIVLRADYLPDSKFIYKFKEDFEFGERVPQLTTSGHLGTESYFGAVTTGSVAWTPNAAFTSSLEASYKVLKDELSAAQYQMELSHRISYFLKETSCFLSTTYSQKDVETTGRSWTLTSSGEFSYKPDRYNDGLLRYNYHKTNENLVDTSQIDLIERYNYNFFTRRGVIRNLATLSQEFGYTETGTFASKLYSYYLQFSGRYSPTERLSLNGSVKYLNDNFGSPTLFYTVGMINNFRLLSTSLNYTLAKRDADNRVEKRLDASVKRSF